LEDGHAAAGFSRAWWRMEQWRLTELWWGRWTVDANGAGANCCSWCVFHGGAMMVVRSRFVWRWRWWRGNMLLTQIV